MRRFIWLGGTLTFNTCRPCAGRSLAPRLRVAVTPPTTATPLPPPCPRALLLDQGRQRRQRRACSGAGSAAPSSSAARPSSIPRRGRQQETTGCADCSREAGSYTVHSPYRDCSDDEKTAAVYPDEDGNPSRLCAECATDSGWDVHSAESVQGLPRGQQDAGSLPRRGREPEPPVRWVCQGGWVRRTQCHLRAGTALRTTARRSMQVVQR